MDRFDFSPLFRSTIGFDRLTRMVDAASRVDNAALSYPPYNIETTGEDAYRLTMAVAGFSPDEVDVTVHENSLLVTGKAKKEEEDGRYLHRGIARRAFERRFSLADHIKVVGASLDQRHAACRPRPRGSRGGQAAQDRDRRARSRRWSSKSKLPEQPLPTRSITKRPRDPGGVFAVPAERVQIQPRHLNHRIGRTALRTISASP